MQGRVRIVAFNFCLVFFLALAPGRPPAAATLCPDPMFSVETDDPALSDRICAAALLARAAASRCGLQQVRPIRIVPSERLVHATGPCLAAFDCSRDVLEILYPTLIGDRLNAGDPYRLLPETVVFQSLLTHEMAHAVLTHSAPETRISIVDHEFTANALEIDALLPDYRRTVLAAHDITPPVRPEQISFLLYSIAPRRFAAISWRYFHAHGCETIQAIAEGSYSFHNPQKLRSPH